MLSIDAMTGHEANRTVLAYLVEHRLVRWPIEHVKADSAPDPLDEGGRLFVEGYGRDVPDRAKFAVGLVRMFVHDGSGEIFAVHWGRLTIVVRFEAAGPEFDGDEMRLGQTMDGPVDVRALGPGWALGDCFADDIDEALTHAWELADARYVAGPR